MRSRSVSPASIATRPPMLLPATCARSIPSASMAANTERANQAASYGAPTGLSDSPKPGRSIATTR